MHLCEEEQKGFQFSFMTEITHTSNHFNLITKLKVCYSFFFCSRSQLMMPPDYVLLHIIAHRHRCYLHTELQFACSPCYKKPSEFNVTYWLVVTYLHAIILWLAEIEGLRNVTSGKHSTSNLFLFKWKFQQDTKQGSWGSRTTHLWFEQHFKSGNMKMELKMDVLESIIIDIYWNNIAV